MFDVTSFLIRWLFLSNLARDVAEIQTLPCQPYYAAPPSSVATLSRPQQEELWRDDCVRGILSYPPGMQRLLLMDALRVELVQQLAREIRSADETMQRVALGVPVQRHATGDDEEDPFLDADTEIVKRFGKSEDEEDSSEPESTEAAAKLVISRNGTNVIEGDDSTSSSSSSSLQSSALLVTVDQPTPEQVQTARSTLRDLRDFLPQLVSAVLKSPPAFDPRLANPIQKLRQLLLRRCLKDPNWGIELCWLLEAEVGRAWKTLFEHRQQTGRRLIVVLPAEKAAVLAKIGTERREAFDLLQDAEQATAYGYTFDPEKMRPSSEADELEEHGIAPRLPSSLSLRRCSHFGDTMHLVDRLTRISLDLRRVPVLQRLDYLKQSLHELNRRIRRRMVTRGDVSIDVEDNRRPFDWPSIEDLTVDMLSYSVHFPLIPQTGVWPDGQSRPISAQTDPQTVEIVRVLNIVVPESRILASRERCPFLVHMEVADTELDGGDARLYANGAPNLGTTVEEALGMSAAAGAAAATQRQYYDHPSYDIPRELLGSEPTRLKEMTMVENLFPRGGSQSLDDYNGGYMYSDPYDSVRQQEYEQLHHHMQLQAEQATMAQQEATAQIERPAVSVGEELLDKVFGQPWNEVCKEIKQASPYGHVKGWRLASFIMKAGEDIRREALVMQIISKMRGWFQEIPESDRPFMRPYTIMCVGGDAGLVECLSDAKSIDEAKKRADGFTSLRDYFERAYAATPSHGPGFGLPPPPRAVGTIPFEKAQDNFLRSLVGYSLVCYVLQIKDRHNANILIDREGHIMHIDFGFVLGDTPKMGKVPIFSERAPFKLSGEFWEVLGGWNIKSGGLGVRFCKMFELAFECASRHADEIASLVEATMLTLDNTPNVARSIANGVRHRLRMRGQPGSRDQKAFIVDLVNAALTSWGTSTYDWLQRNMNGYQ